MTETIVGLGQVLAGAQPFSLGNINDTFRGIILTTHGERSAIIKDLDLKELANEVFVAALGIQMGLPIPPPYIALAMPDRLDVQKGPAFGGGKLVYASVDVAQPQVAMLYSQGGGPAVLHRLAQWRELGRLYGFDSLVANIDRHAGNVLFCGYREVWLIDHGWCFTGPEWQPEDLVAPDCAVTSRLSEWMTPALNAGQRYATASVAATVQEVARQINFKALVEANHVADLLTSGDLEALLYFLQNRCPHVPRLAASTLGIEKLL